MGRSETSSAPRTPIRLASPSPTPPIISTPPSQFHSPSLTRSPLLTSFDHKMGSSEISSTPRTPIRLASPAPTPPIISAPPSQFHSPSLSRSPLLASFDHIEIASTSKTPKSITPRLRTPRFITPLGSPIRKALKLTKLDPHDAWLPITESRNGNAFYAAFHTLCSGIGIQALVLPVAFTFLGWAWGIISLTLTFVWQLYTLYLLVQLHESTETGLRYSRYLQLSAVAFGEKVTNFLVMIPVMYLSAGTCIPLLIIGGSTLRIIFETLCGPTCSTQPLTPMEWYVVFTCAAVVLSQLPNLNSIAGVSLVGAITAVGYCTLIWVVSVAEGRVDGVSYSPLKPESQTASVFGVLNALGIIVFAFRGHNLVLEIQATMPSSEKHPSRVPMWKGVKFAYLLVAICLYPLAIGGYWAYGQLIPTNGGMLTALYAFHGQDVSRVILGLTGLFVIINAVSSFQIYAMPVFDDMESHYTKKKKQPCPWWLRIIFRTFFGFFSLFMAVAVPAVGTVAGLVGGIAVPVTLGYPCFMWLKIKKPRVYSPTWFVNWGLGVLGMALSVVLVAAGLFVVFDNGMKVEFFKPQ